MHRFLPILALMLLGALGTGCTMSDREYVRNHIALLPARKQPLQEQPLLAGMAAPAPVPESR